MSKTMIGTLFSWHNVNAVVSIIFKPLAIASENERLSYFVAKGSFSGSAV